MAALGVIAAGIQVAASQAPAARLLVLLRDASALAVVDPAAGTVLGQVPTVRGPHEVTASTGVTVTQSQMDAIALVPDAFHGDWNYKLAPR